MAKKGLEIGKSFLKSDFAKSIGNEALNMGKDALKNVAVNVLTGEKSFKEAANDELNIAKKKIGEAIKGSGKRKRKNNISPSQNLKKKIPFYLLD